MKNRNLLMIPGPIEFEPAVLSALGAPTTSHVAQNFIDVFAQALNDMRNVWRAPSGQPFIISGSGTLAIEIPIANLIIPGDAALVISTGYFGERYSDILKRYGAKVTILRAPLGGIVEIETIKDELKKHSYKLLTFTHVDTSTAVRVDPKTIGQIGQEHNVLTILDGVCSIGGEELHQEEWGIDVALTASQKAIGVPPGLALMMVSPKALETWKKRNTPVANYYADWANWLPIMEAYESKKPSYFATPPVNLICALQVSLKQILTEGLDIRTQRHHHISRACRAALQAMQLKQIPLQSEYAASTLSAPFYPNEIQGVNLLSKVKKSGVILAGGLHPEIKSKYFRIGHMGAILSGDLLATIGAIEAALISCGHQIKAGSGIEAAQNILINF